MPEPRRIVRIRKPRRRIGDIKAQQAQAQRSQPDLGATGRLLKFQAAQRDVRRRELTPGQKGTLRKKNFSSTVVPLERAPSQLVRGFSGQRPARRVMGAALGGAGNVTTRSQGRPKTAISLRNTRSSTASGIRSLARHEVTHQLSRTGADAQHKQIVKVGGTGGGVKSGKKFFRSIERSGSPKTRKIVRVGN